MKTIILFTLIFGTYNAIFGQRIPSPRPVNPYPVPQIPRDPEWEPPILTRPVPKEIVIPTVVEKWWKSLPTEEKESFIYSGLGTPNAEDYNKLLVLNNAISLFFHIAELSELSESPTRIEISTKVNELISMIKLQNSDFGKLRTLKSIQEDIKVLPCQLIGLSHFLQISPPLMEKLALLYSPKDITEIKFPKSVNAEFPGKVARTFTYDPERPWILIPEETPSDAMLREAWNKNGWQRWYFNYSQIINSLNNQNSLETFEEYGNKTSKAMRSYDIRETLRKRAYFTQQASKILTVLDEVKINSSKTINSASTSLKETITLSNQRKSKLLDLLSKEQIALATELQASSDQLVQPQSEVDSVNKMVTSLKTNIDETQKRLLEINNLIDQKQEKITDHQKRIISIQADLEKTSIESDRLRIIKYDCGKLSEDECLQTKAQLDFELKRLEDMEKSVSKIEELGKEIFDVEKAILLENKDLENYQNERLIKFEEFKANNNKYIVAYQELLEKRKNLDILAAKFQSVQAKYNDSLKDLENLKNAKIVYVEINQVNAPGSLNDCK